MMRMKIAISGSSGLMGSYLVKGFKAQGHEIIRIARNPSGLKNEEKGVLWDIEKGWIDSGKLEGLDVVIHLAGCNLADRRWTNDYKRMIQESRVQGTSLLSRTIAGLKKPPRILLSASAVGYYGASFGEKRKDESGDRGKDFLAHVCADWEEATRPASAAGIRVVFLRFGVVLSPQGGALAKMLPVFKIGLGGKLGSGQQVMSWIALDEIPSIISYLIKEEKITGAVNCVSPAPVTNAEFTRILGEAVGRPTVFPVPAFAIKFLLGEMGEALLLGGAYIVPKRLLDTGYRFQYPDLKSALEGVLKNSY